MPRQKRKLTKEEKAAKQKRRRETMIIFVNGKQKRVPRQPPIDDYAWLNNDPIWLLQNEMYEELHALDNAENADLNLPGPEGSPTSDPPNDRQSWGGEQDPDEDDLPF